MAKQKKATIATIFAILHGLIKEINALDIPYDGNFSYDGVSVRVDEDGIVVEDSYGEVIGTYETAEEVEAKLRAIIAGNEIVGTVTVGDETAEVRRSGISVGCQNVTFEQFDELAKLVAQARKN